MTGKQAGSPRPKKFRGYGIDLTAEQMTAGVKFDTPAESGCTVADDPSIYVCSGGKAFTFDAIDSEGVTCSFASSMVSKDPRGDR